MRLTIDQAIQPIALLPGKAIVLLHGHNVQIGSPRQRDAVLRCVADIFRGIELDMQNFM